MGQLQDGDVVALPSWSALVLVPGGKDWVSLEPTEPPTLAAGMEHLDGDVYMV